MFPFFFSDTQQTNPHLINCIGNPDSFCLQGVSRRFCEGKKFGTYAHPTICNKFIYCSPGRQDVETCPVGEGFNPFFRNCDWPGFLRCVDINISKYFFKTITSGWFLSLIFNPEVPRSQPLDSFKVGSAFNFSEVDQMSISNFWGLRHKKKTVFSGGAVALGQLNPIHKKRLWSFF